MTQPVTFEPNARYVLHGVGYQVLQMLDDGTQVVRNLTTNALITHRVTELWQAWQDNTLEFAREGPNLQQRAETSLKTAYTIADLADLPTPLQDITWHRYQLIHPLIHMSSRQRTKQVVEERIQTYLFSLEEENIPRREAFLLSLTPAKDSSVQQEASADAVPALSNNAHGHSSRRDSHQEHYPNHSLISHLVRLHDGFVVMGKAMEISAAWFPPTINAVPNTTVSLQ